MEPAFKLELQPLERNTEERSRVDNCLKAHVVDIEPEWHGDGKGADSIKGAIMGAANTEIKRCDPSIAVPNFPIHGGKSIAMIGPNGSGKSTVFDAFMARGGADFTAGAHGYNKGIHGRDKLRIARLNQDELLHDILDMRVDDVIEEITEKTKGDFPVDWENIDYDDQRQYDAAMANQEAQQRIEELVSKVRQLFEIDIFAERQVKELSGGEKTKLSIIMLLASEPDVLLLDEPTNHLDLESISKLVGLFDKYKKAGAAIVNVSHVEWFLEMAGQDGTVEIERQGGTRRVVSSTSPYKKYMKKEAGSDMLESEINWQYNDSISEGNGLFQSADDISIPNSPINNLQLPSMQVGDLVVITGKNGTGKTKLMEAMVDSESNLIKKNKGIQIAYMPQFWPEKVQEGSLEEFFYWIKGAINPHSKIEVTRFTKELRSIGFAYDKSDLLSKKLSSYSGGEQRMMWFVAASVIEGTDALVLDEPTNHMDSKSMGHVVAAIRNYRGAIILSTHDLRLMREIDRSPGNSRAGQGAINLVFERDKNGMTVLNVSREKLFDSAQKTIKRALNNSKRI